MDAQKVTIEIAPSNPATCQLDKPMVFLVFFNYLSFGRPLATKTIQHVSNANPEGTERFKGPSTLDIIALKSSPAMQISVSSKLHEDNHSTRFKYKSARHGTLSGHHRARHKRS